MKKIGFLFTILFVVVVAGCSQMSSKEENDIVLTISAAASLQNVLEDIAENYEEGHPNVEIQYNFGASGSLVKQIEQGAPVDIFFSASSEKFEELKTKDFIEDSVAFIGNELVLITSEKTDLQISAIDDLNSSQVEKISIGTPSIVPAGTYAKQTLDSYELWTELESKIVYAKDVRQVLAYVETGNVQAGFVYKTDAISSKKARIITTVPQEKHDSITYPVGVLKNTETPTEAEQYYDYLQSEAVKDIWIKYGFTFIQ